MDPSAGASVLFMPLVHCASTNLGHAAAAFAAAAAAAARVNVLMLM